MSSSETGYTPIEDEALRLVLNEDRPLKIINAFENKSAAIIKLPKYNNNYLYIVKFLDEDISKYLRGQKRLSIFIILLKIKIQELKFHLP